jgi:hypothetical protein
LTRCIFAILAIAALQSWASETPSSPAIYPSVSVSLPGNIPSESVQIAYYLVGPFGGHGAYAEQRVGLHFVEIAASLEGKPATEIRMIVYAPGCEIQTFAIHLTDSSRVNQDFQCQPVRSAMLWGEIVPEELVRDENTELIVTYMAFGAHQFFGIVDGPVTGFRLATVPPNPNGTFLVEVPQFSADSGRSSSQRGASLFLMLRDSKTWNPIAENLEPELPEFRFEDHSLRIRPYYPSGLKFVAGPF